MPQRTEEQRHLRALYRRATLCLVRCFYGVGQVALNPFEHEFVSFLNNPGLKRRTDKIALSNFCRYEDQMASEVLARVKEKLMTVLPFGVSVSHEQIFRVLEACEKSRYKKDLLAEPLADNCKSQALTHLVFVLRGPQ